MASILKIDELQGNTAVGDITITSEGGSATQSLQQGLAKARFTFNYTAALDSLNISSVTDSATGACFGNFSSAMTNNDYAHPVMTGAYRTRFEGTGPDGTTSRTNTIDTFNSSGSSADDAIINCTAHGDLA